MSKNDFENLGEYLYGRRWKSRVAIDFAVGRRSVYRWLDSEPPVHLIDRIVDSAVLKFASELEHTISAKELSVINPPFDCSQQIKKKFICKINTLITS